MQTSGRTSYIRNTEGKQVAYWAGEQVYQNIAVDDRCSSSIFAPVFDFTHACPLEWATRSSERSPSHYNYFNTEGSLHLWNLLEYEQSVTGKFLLRKFHLGKFHLENSSYGKTM